MAWVPLFFTKSPNGADAAGLQIWIWNLLLWPKASWLWSSKFCGRQRPMLPPIRVSSPFWVHENYTSQLSLQVGRPWTSCSQWERDTYYFWAKEGKGPCRSSGSLFPVVEKYGDFVLRWARPNIIAAWILGSPRTAASGYHLTYSRVYHRRK